MGGKCNRRLPRIVWRGKALWWHALLLQESLIMNPQKGSYLDHLKALRCSIFEDILCLWTPPMAPIGLGGSYIPLWYGMREVHSFLVPTSVPRKKMVTLLLPV